MIPKRWLSRACLVALAVVVAWRARSFDFVTDDAYISFVYARNLVEHGELVFNLGERVEGYTNFLWTLLLAAGMAIGVAPESSSNALALVCAMATLPVVRGLSRLVLAPGGAWPLLPPALLALGASWGCWASGGLETHLFTFLVTLGTWLHLRDGDARGPLLFTVAALVRPEGALFFAAAVVHRAWNRWADPAKRWTVDRSDLAFVLPFLIVHTTYVGWRWWYYGWPLPNTFYVKTGITPELRDQVQAQGLYYVARWARETGMYYAWPFALVGAWKGGAAGRWLFAVATIYLAYVSRVGGDFMGLHRFVLPVFPAAAVLSAAGLQRVLRALPVTTARWAIPAAIAVLLTHYAHVQEALAKSSRISGTHRRIETPRSLAVYALTHGNAGRALAPLMTRDDYAVVGGAGALPYHAGLRAVDSFGLISEKIAHEVPATDYRPGHMKRPSVDYLLALGGTLSFTCQDFHANPDDATMCPDVDAWLAGGYEIATVRVAGNPTKAAYYSFMRQADRAWSWPAKPAPL